MGNEDRRFQEVEDTLTGLMQDDEVPKWLVEAIRIANHEAKCLLDAGEKPSAPPQFTYPH
jgi:hypothetical protein